MVASSNDPGIDAEELSLPESVRQLDELLQVSEENWYFNWLRWLCEQLPDATAALLVADEVGNGQFHARAVWPNEDIQDELLREAAAATLRRREPIITPLDDGQHQVGSYPIHVHGTVRAVVTLLFTSTAEEHLHKVLAIIEFCSGWLELRFSRGALDQLGAHNERQEIVVESIAEVLGERDFNHAALRFVNLLGRHLEAERVVLGFVKRDEVEIHSQSDSSGHSDKHELVKLSRAALQEAVDQQESVLWPAPPERATISLAHASLAEAQANRALLSVPLVDKELCYGAVLFERGEEAPFSEEEQARAEALANYVGAVLEEKRQSNLPLYAYALRSMGTQLSRLLGPGYLGRKIAVMALVLVTAFFSLMPGTYYLGAEAVLEGAELRAIVVPFEGYLQSASHRAGDKVPEGTVLAELDTRELRLQRMSWTSQQATSRRQYEDALARQERAQVQIANAQMNRAAAELELLDYQIGQAELVAPFDALVVSGDLSQRIGSVVRQGDVLFELSPSREFRLTLYVDEFRINDIEAGQGGRLVLAALPEMEFAFTVTRINPVAEVRDGATTYRVEADLEGDVAPLQVGLEGVAKVYIDERLLFSVWTRGITDWMRLQLWRFWG